MTCNSCAAHKVRVGEVQSGVKHKVGLHDAPGALTDLVEEPGTPHRHSALVAILRKGNSVTVAPPDATNNHDSYRAFKVAGTRSVFSTVAPSNFSLGV